MFLFRGNSKGYKTSRRKCAPYLHPLAHQTWKVLSLPSKKAAECLFPWVGWKSGFEFRFCTQSYLLFYATGLLNEMHKESLVPKIVPHPSRAVPSSEVWDNQVSSYLYLTWSYLSCICCCQGLLLGQGSWTEIPLALCFIQLRQSPGSGSTSMRTRCVC